MIGHAGIDAISPGMDRASFRQPRNELALLLKQCILKKRKGTTEWGVYNICNTT